jgi:hypothetical protein
MTTRDNMEKMEKLASNGTDCTTWKVHGYLLIVIRIAAGAYRSTALSVLSPALCVTSASATNGAEGEERYIRLT